MSDWEQRLRLYSATASNSRQRSVSPSANNSIVGGIDLVVPRGHVTSADTEALSYHRAKSPNALERLRASTAMNLVALELRGAGDSQTKLPTRTASPAPLRSTQPTAPAYNVNAPMRSSAEVLAAEAVRRAGSPLRYPTASTAAASPPYLGNNSSPKSHPPLSTGINVTSSSSASALGGRHSSPIRSTTLPSANPSSLHGGLHNWGHSSPPSQVLADSFNPQTILQMLESKIRGLETRNQQLEASVDTLSAKNQELSRDVLECEGRLANQTALQSAVASLQHEIDRLREELLASAQREERRVEEVRRRAGAEVEDARRIAASREQEITSLRSAIRQLANIERSVD